MKLYLALRVEAYKQKLPSGEIGRMRVFSELAALKKTYGENCGYKIIHLPKEKR